MPLQRIVAPDLIAVGDVGWQGAPQVVEEPLLMLVIKFLHVIPKRSLQFAVGLRMIDGRMNQPEA
jgi:hypothetical protein